MGFAVFPKVLNTWDSLGEAYMKHDDKKKSKGELQEIA